MGTFAGLDEFAKELFKVPPRPATYLHYRTTMHIEARLPLRIDPFLAFEKVYLLDQHGKRFIELPTSELDAETLEMLCQDFVTRVFETAGKERPAPKPLAPIIPEPEHVILTTTTTDTWMLGMVETYTITPEGWLDMNKPKWMKEAILEQLVHSDQTGRVLCKKGGTGSFIEVEWNDKVQVDEYGVLFLIRRDNYVPINIGKLPSTR